MGVRDAVRDGPVSENPFLALVAEALADAGRDLEIDADLNTIDVASPDPLIGQVLAVVRPIARAVTFYVVHPTLVPEAQYFDVADLLVHAAPDLLDTSLELEQGAVAFGSPSCSVPSCSTSTTSAFCSSPRSRPSRPPRPAIGTRSTP